MTVLMCRSGGNVCCWGCRCLAFMDWHSRAVLAWRVSNTMDTRFCVAALEKALARFGRPEIFNTDQGAQSASADFTGALRVAGIRLSMDGKGRWLDSVHRAALAGR